MPTDFPLRITTRTGDPVAGACVAVRVEMKQKNDYVCLRGPTNANGMLFLELDRLKSYFEQSAHMFLMDYVGISQDTVAGVSFSLLSFKEIEQARSAFRQFSRHLNYPPGYLDMLHACRNMLSSNDIQSLQVIPQFAIADLLTGLIQ